MPVELSAYLAKLDYIANTKKDPSPSTAPRHYDPLSRHRLSYLSGGGGSGKTTRAIEHFRQKKPLSSPRPIAWLKRCGPGASWPRPTTASANYYEVEEVDNRAKHPLLKTLKKRIRLQPDMVQCQEIRKVLPGYLGWVRFVEAWKPCDLILTSSQKLLFERLLGASPLSSGRYKAAEYHCHHPRALTGGQAKSAGACPERRF